MTSTRVTPWPRVLLEGVVIVASILLAFGIDAWWDRTQDDARGAEYAEALLAEVAANLQHLDATASGVQRSIEATTSIRGWLAGDLSIAVYDSISLQFTAANAVSILTPITNTHDQLVATGDLRLLRPGVRDALGAWQRELRNATEYWDTYVLSFRTQTLDPYVMERLNWAELVALFRDELKDSSVRPRTDWARLAGDQELHNLLTHILLLNSERLIAYGRLRGALNDLDAQLRREVRVARSTG